MAYKAIDFSAWYQNISKVFWCFTHEPFLLLHSAHRTVTSMTMAKVPIKYSHNTLSAHPPLFFFHFYSLVTYFWQVINSWMTTAFHAQRLKMLLDWKYRFHFSIFPRYHPLKNDFTFICYHSDVVTLYHPRVHLSFFSPSAHKIILLYLY